MPQKIILPTSFIFNPVGFALAKCFFKDKSTYITMGGIDLTTVKALEIPKLLKAIRLYKKENPDWYIVECETKDCNVKIKI